MALKPREALIANAFATAIYCSTTEAHSRHVRIQIEQTEKALLKLNPKLDVAEFRERCRSPF